MTATPQDLPERRFLAPAGLDDMLDYFLYLAYRDCGYVTENLCKAEFGINRRRWRILASLLDREGGTVGDLARLADLDFAQTSRTVGTMVREGLLKRRSQPGNARYAQILLTDAGRDLCNRVMRRYVQANQALLAPFSETEVLTLVNLLSRLRLRAAEMLDAEAGPDGGGERSACPKSEGGQA